MSVLDDEQILIEYLQVYARENRKKLEVFFDGAPVGKSGSRNYGLVQAVFVRKGMTADEAIRIRLKKLKKNARNYIVVSSDRQVQAEARDVGATIIRSEDFSEEVIQAGYRSVSNDQIDETFLNKNEVEEWLRLFGDEENKH